MTVADEFSAFNDACKIPASKIGSIAARYQRITRQLNRDFWSTESETAHSLYTGSYGRDTAAKGISDLDMGFVLPYRIYEQYHAYQNNGQSSLLQAVKKSLQNTYPTSDIAGDGQVAVNPFRRRYHVRDPAGVREQGRIELDLSQRERWRIVEGL
jgi:Second Messenger Oligonucleotide or Dinucleotide Synthetase domain